MQGRFNTIIPFGMPGAAVGVENTVAINAAATWSAFVFIGQNRTLAKVRILTDSVTGSPATSEITAHLQADSAGAPSGTTIESRPVTSLAESFGTKVFEGFSTALTLGVRYWIVFKNTNATPASNYVTFQYATNAIPYIEEAENASLLYGWQRRLTTDSGGSWTAAPSPMFGIEIEYADGELDGLPYMRDVVSDATSGIYSDHEAGNRFTTPSGAKMNVRGVALLTSPWTGTPTGSLRLRLYEGDTLVRTTPALTPTVDPNNALIWGFFDEPYALLPNTSYRVTLGETTQSDSSSNRYNVRYHRYIVENRAVFNAQFDYWNGSVWTNVLPSAFVPGALWLEPGAEFISADENVYPDEDISAGSWSPSTGSDLYAMLDDDPVNDTQRAVSSSGSSDDSMTLGFPPVETPTGTVTLKIRTRTGS